MERHDSLRLLHSRQIEVAVLDPAIADFLPAGNRLMMVFVLYRDEIRVFAATNRKIELADRISTRGVDESSLAEQLAKVAAGNGRRPVAILVDSTDSLPFTLARKDESRKGRIDVKFACEEQIPQSAEEIEVGVIRESGFGIAVARAAVAPILDACLKCNVPVEHIGILPLHSLYRLIDTQAVEKNGTLILSNDTGVDLIGYSNGQPNRWEWFPVEGEISQSSDFRLSLLTADKPFYFYDSPSGSRRNLPTNGWIHLPADFNAELAAVESACAAASGQSDTAFEISSAKAGLTAFDQSASRSLVAAATVLLIAVAAWFWTTAIRERKQISELRSATKQLYRDHVPNGPNTSLIARTMRTRLQQARQWQAASEVFDSTNQIVDSIGKLLRSVPDDESVNLKAIDVLPGAVRLEGEVEDLERLVSFRDRLADNGLVASTRELRKSFQLNLAKKPGEDSGK